MTHRPRARQRILPLRAPFRRATARASSLGAMAEQVGGDEPAVGGAPGPAVGGLEGPGLDIPDWHPVWAMHDVVLFREVPSWHALIKRL